MSNRTTLRVITLMLGLAANTAWCNESAEAQSTSSEPAADPELRQFHSANGLLQRGLYEAAATEYRQFLAEHPNHAKSAVAHYGLGVCLFRLNKPDEAEVQLRTVAETRDFEFASEALFMLGQCQMNRGQFKDAAGSLDRLVRQHADNDLADDGAALLVESRFRAGDHEQAIVACEMLDKKWPDSTLRERADFFAAQSMVARNDSAGAAKQLEASLAKFPAGPFADRSGILLAQCKQRAGKADAAAAQYQRIVEAGSSEFMPDALYGLATLLYEKKQFDQAARLLDQLNEKYPQHSSSASARMMRGRIAFEQSEYEQAAQIFAAAAKDSKDRQDQAAYWQAKCELRLGKNQEAASHLNAAIKKHPESPLMPEMMFDRAVAMVRADNAQAPEALQAFREKYPEHALAADALQMAAMWQHQHKQYDRSAEICAEFLAAYPKHNEAVSIAFLLAENQYLGDHLKQAADSFNQYLQQFPTGPQVEQAQYRLGVALYRLNDLDGALQALDKLSAKAEKDPAFNNALLVLGDIQFQKQDWAKAEAMLRAYLETAKDQSSAIDALLKLGLAQARQDHHVEAVATFDRLLSSEGSKAVRTQVQFERGQCLLALKKNDEAAAAFERVVKADPKSTWAAHAMNHLAGLAMQQKQYPAAADLYAKVAACGIEDLRAEALYQQGQALMAAKDYSGAWKSFTALIDEYPKSVKTPPAAARRAIASCRLKKFEEALSEIVKVQKGDSSKLDASLRSTLAYEKAWCLRELKKPDEARQAYLDMLNDGSLDDPSLRSHAKLELSELDAAAGRKDDAISVLKSLVSSEASADPVPEQVREQATYRLGVCEFEAERYKEAAALLGEFLKNSEPGPLTASARVYCGESLFKTSQFKNAAALFAKVIEESPNDPAAGTAMLRLGECQAQLQQWDQSAQTFSDFLQKNPKSDVWFQAQFGIGWALENRAQYDKAIDAYRKVVDAHQGPTAARAQFQIGECHFALKQHDDALRELMKVDILYAYPEWSAAALYEAGRCFEALNKPADAKTQFEQVRTKYPQSQWASMAQKRLAELSDPKSQANAIQRSENRSP